MSPWFRVSVFGVAVTSVLYLVQCSIKEILNSFINRSREPSESEPELAATKLNRKSKPAPIFVPQPVLAVRKEDALVRPDGTFTNVCSRVEETFSSFPPPRSTIESTFKPIEMSDPRSVHTKSLKHKKPPVITTETYDDRQRTRDERTPDNEYSAEQVSQKVFDFLEIDEPESLSLGDETIDSRASPIPNEEVIDLDSPRFEYYEEIKFKDPVLYGQSRPVEQREVYETSDLPESSRRRQYATQMVVDETGKPVTSTTTRKYYVKGVRDPQQVKEYKYVQLFDPNNLDESEVSPYDEPQRTVQIRDGTRTVVRTIRRRIIRKVVIINGKETVTEEVVEEPVEETVSEYDRPEITEIEDDGQQEPRKQFYVVSKKVEEPKSESPDSSRSRPDEYPAFDVRKMKSVLRPEAKEFTPSYSLSKSTDISLPQDNSISLDTTKPARFGFMIRDSPLDVSEHSLPEEMKADDSVSEPTSNVIYISSKEEVKKGVRPQRKKKKKRKGEKDTEEPEKTGDDQNDTESLDSYEDESDEDLIEKGGRVIKTTKTIVVTKDSFEKGKSPSFSDSKAKDSKPKKGSKDSLEEIEKMIIVTDDKTRKSHERKDDEKKRKEPTEAKAVVTISSEKSVERKPKDGKTPIEHEAPEKAIPVEESKDKPKPRSEMPKEKERSPTDKETDKKTKDKKGKPDDVEDKEKPKAEEVTPKEQRADELKPKDKKETKTKTDTKQKPEDDVKVVVKEEDRKTPEREKLRPVGTAVTETIKFEQEPGKKGKPEAFGKAPEKPKHKFFDITQFIEQEQQPTVDEPSVKEKGDEGVKGKSPESDKPKPEKPVKDEEPSKTGRPDEKDKTRGKKEKTPDKDKLFRKEVKSSQPDKPKDEEALKVGQPKEEKDKGRPVDESKTPKQREQEPVKVSKEKEEKPEKGKPKEEKPEQIAKVTEVPSALEKDKLPKKEEISKVEKPKDDKKKEHKTPEVTEQDKLSLKDREFKVGKPKDIKDKDKRGKAPEKDETEPIGVSKSIENKTFPTHEHETHKTEKPEQKDETKPTKKHDKGKKEKTPEDDKSKPGKDISETLKFIQFGYRVSPEDERPEVVKRTQEKPKDKTADKKKPIEIGKKPVQQKPVSEDDELLKIAKLSERKENTLDKDKAVELDEVPEEPKQSEKPKDGTDKPKQLKVRPEDDELLRIAKLPDRKEKTPDKDKPIELGKASEQPTQTDKPKDGKEKKGKKPEKDKPEDLAKAPEQPQTQEPSKVVEKPVEEKDKNRQDKKEKPTQKDKSKPSEKNTFDVTAFIEHEKPSSKDTLDMAGKPAQDRPKDQEEEEKPKQPKLPSEDDELLRVVRLTERKEKTPEQIKPAEVEKTSKQPTQPDKPKDDKEKKGKKPDKDKPEELAKAPEQPKSQEPSKVVEKPVEEKDKDKKGKPTQKDKSKPSQKDTFDVTAFIEHEKTLMKDQQDKATKPDEKKPTDDKVTEQKPKVFSEDDQILKVVSITGRKEKAPEKDKPRVPEQPIDTGEPQDDKGKKPDNDKPEEFGKAPQLPLDNDKLKDDKDKKGKKPDKTKPEELVKARDEPTPKDVKRKEEKPKQPTAVPEDDELLRIVRLTGRKEKTPEKDKPVEFGKAPELPAEPGKPKDDKDRKGKKPDKDKPEELGKAPEQPKSQEPLKAVEKPSEEKDKEKKGKPTQKDKAKPSEKDTFDITEFIAHEKPSTTETIDKVEKPKDDKAWKEKSLDKDKPAELGKSEPHKDDQEEMKKPVEKSKPAELDKKPEKTKPSTGKEEPQKADLPVDDKEKNKKDKVPKKDKLQEIDKKTEHPKAHSGEEKLTLRGRPTEKDTREKTPDKDKPVDFGKVPEQLGRGEKPKTDEESKQKAQGKDKPFDVSKTSHQQKLPPEEEDISKSGKRKDKGKKEKTPEDDKSKPAKDISETLKFIQFGYRVSPEDERPEVVKHTQEKLKDKTPDKDVSKKPVSEDDELLKVQRLTGRKEKTPEKPVELGKAPEQLIESKKPIDERDKKEMKPDKDKPDDFTKKSEKPKLSSEDDELLRVVKLTDRKEKTPDKNKTIELGRVPEQSTETDKPKDREEKKGKKPDKEKPEEFAKAPEEPKQSEKPKDGKDKPKQLKERPEDDELLRIAKLPDRKEKTPDKDKPIELGKASEQPPDTSKPIDEKDKKGKKPDKDKPREFGEAPQQPKSSEALKARATPTDEKEKDRKEKLTQKDKDTLDITKITEHEKPKDQRLQTFKPEDTKDVDKDKFKLVKREVVETITLSREKLPSKDFIEVKKLIEHEKSPVGEQVLFREDEPAEEMKKGKKEKTPDKDKTQQREQKVLEVAKLIDHEKPQKEESDSLKIGKPAEGKSKTKKDQDKPKGLEKEVFGTMEFIQREKTFPEDHVTFTDTFGIVKTQEPTKVDKDKDKKAPEKPVDFGKTTEPKEQEPSKVGKPEDKEKKEKTPEEPKLSGQEKLPSKKDEVFEGKPKEEKDKASEDNKFPSKDEQPSESVKPKDDKKKDKGRKEKTPEKDQLKSVNAFKPEEKGKVPEKEHEPSVRDKPKDDKDKPAEVDKASQQPKGKGKKEKSPEDDKSKPGKEISDTLKFIQFGYRVSPEDERSKVVKLTEDKPEETVKGKSPPKGTTKHTIVKVIETTESIQEPKDGKRSDKITVEKAQEDNTKPVGKVAEDIKPKDAEQVGKPKEGKHKTKEDKPQEDKSKPVGMEPLEKVKSLDEGKIPPKGIKEKTPEDKTRKEKPVDKKEKTPENDKVKSLEKDKPTTIQKGGVDVITFIQHEKSPVSDRKPLDIKEKDKGKKDKPVDKDKTKEPSLEKDLTDTIKFIEGEKPVDRKDKERKEKIPDGEKSQKPDATKEVEPSKPGKPKDVKEKDDWKKEKTPETPKLHEEKPKDKDKKEKSPDKDKTSDIGKVQEQPREITQKVSQPKDDKERKEKTSVDYKTIPAVDKLPSKKQEPSKPVKEEDKVDKTLKEDKPVESGKKPGKPEPSSEKVGEVDDDKEKGKKDRAPKKDKPIRFGEPEQLKWGEKPIDEIEPFYVGKKPEQQKLPSQEELLKGVKPTDNEKEKTPEEDKTKPGKVVTATLKFIQQETYPSEQDEPLEVTTSTLEPPKRITKERSPAKDTPKHVVVQITEKIKDENIPSEGQEPSRDKQAEEKDRDKKEKPTQKDKSKPSEKDTFGVTAFIEHEKPSTKDTQDKTTKPVERKTKDDKKKEGRPKTPDDDKPIELDKAPEQPSDTGKPKDDKDKKGKKPDKDKPEEFGKAPEQPKHGTDKPKQLKVRPEDDELLRIAKLPDRKEKTPDKDKPIELGKASEQPTQTDKPKDGKEKKGKKPDKDKPEDLAKAPERPQTQEPSKVMDNPNEEKDKDKKEKPTQKDKSKPSEKNTFDVTAFIEHEKPSSKDTLDKVEKPEAQPKDKEGKPKHPKVLSEDDELLRVVRFTGRKEETPAEEEKPKDDKERKGKTPDALTEKDKAPEKIKLLPEDDELLKIARLTGRKEKTPDTDKPVELGKAPEQSVDTGKPKDDKGKKGKKPDKDDPVEAAKKPEEQKLPSEEERFRVDKPIGRKEKTPDEEKLKREAGVTETLKFIQQETYPSQQDEPSKDNKGVKPSDKDKRVRETTPKFGVDTLETANLIGHEKPESKKPDSLKFKIVTQGYDEKGEPKKPGETLGEYETIKDGRRVVTSFTKDEYPEDDDSQKKDKKKPEDKDFKPSQKTPETESARRKGKNKKETELPKETEGKQKDPSQKISVFGKESEKPEDKRVREVLVGKDVKPKPGVEKDPEDTKDSFASIVRKGEKKTPERTKEKPEEPEAVKGKKKDKKPKSTTKHDEDVPTEEEEEKTSEPETVEKEDQPIDDQTSLTGTIVSMTKKFFGLPFGGRKEPKPETDKPEEDTKPSSKPDKEDKAPKKKDKKKEQKEDTEKPTEREPYKEKKPEAVGKEKTVSLGWSVPDEPEDEQRETSKTVLFPDKPSETQPQHGVISAPVGKKPEADAFGKLVHKPQKPEKSLEPEKAEAKPSKPSAPTYADLFTQTSTPETSPRDTDKVHKTSQTKEYQTTEEGIQTEDDHGKVPVHEYRVHVHKGEEPDDGKQTTEKYQQTSKPQSPAVTTTTVSSQTSPQAMSPKERDSKKKEKVVRAKFVDKKSGKSKPEDEEDENEELESGEPDESQVSRPGEEKLEKGRDEPFGVYVKAKVSVTPTDVSSKKEDKKERKRKWKGEAGQEDEPTDDIEVTGVVSVDSPKDLIESETQSWRGVPTPQAEVSVNVKPREKFVTDFLEGERAALDTTKDDPKDPKGKKDKKSKKPIKDREDEFRLREGGDKPKGVPTRKGTSPSSESDEPRDEDDEYDIDVNVRVGGDKKKGVRTPGSKHRPESEVDINAGITFDPSDERRVRREKGTKPEDDDKYKVSVDVKVKSGETPPKTPGKTADMGINVPSPETPLQPEDLNLYLEKAKTLGEDRSKKMQNMKNNKRGYTWIIPSSRFVQEEPVKTNSKDIDDNVNKLRDAIARRDYILVQRIFVYLIRNIDDWLELVEYRIRLNRGNPNEGPNQEKVNELRYLNDEIDGVGRNVRELLKTIKDVPKSDKSDIISQLRTYVEQLEPQIKEIQETSEMEKDNAVKDLSRWEEFLNGVNNMSVIVAENRNNLDRVLDSDGSTSSKLEELEKIELANREYMNRALQLTALAKDLANEFPNQEIPPETYTTLEATKMVQSNLDSERDRLLQLLSLADEYEQTLKEFAQVIEVADNLVESPITITSLQHLQDEMQKHRKFFVNLSHCRAILESLESNLDDETRGLYNSLHTKLHAKASSILDKAASRAQQMAMAASKWTILDKGVRNEQQWLQVAHQRLPDLQQVKSTDYDQYISLYQSLASDTAMHHAKILQLMDVANNLQDIITCVGLERFYDDYLNVILKLQEEIRMSLEKLLAFQDMWTLYEIMTKKLDAWMKATEEDLKTLKAAPDRAKMRQFWELKAQYEVHNRLKQEMGNNFEKAVQFLPIADEMYQRQILGKLEDRWKKLEKEIKGIQDSAMATLSAPDVPVNEKLKLLEDELNELNDTVNDLHGIIKTDEELNLYIERLQVLNERLDTIQEELGRLGLLPATESEKVGYLLGLARGLEQQLLEELNQSHCLREKLLALQKGLERTKRNQNTITGMLDQCGAAQSMGSEVVEQAVRTCENVSADLSEQWQDMMDLRKVLHNLPMKLRLSVSPIGVEREFSQLQEIHTVLEERCASLLHLLRHRLSLWKKFEKQLEKVQQNLEDTDYMVELLTLQGSVDFDRLQTATDRLKDLHDSVAEREDLIRELKELADPLVSSCDPEVASQLNAQVDETVTAWNDTKKNLYQIVDKYKDAVKLWKNYREGRDDIRKWIDQQWGALDILQDKPEEAVQHIKECKETLANQKARLDELKKLVAQIAADIGLDPGSFLECEVEDLGKRLEDVKDTLTTLTSVAESNSQGKDDCKDELVKAKKFLGSVQKSLNVVGEDGNTLSTLRDHLLALTKTESQVQNVKERSIKMNEKPHEIRNETSVVEILELWQQVFQETFQQYYRLSAKLVKSQDGAAALQLWQEYLRHVQTFLAGSLPEDYDGLRETQRLCEVHQNLLTSQQSVLLSRKDDPGIRDFSQALQEQFNSLANLHNETLARIMDRHNEVNKRLKLWDTYRHDQAKLLSWLRDMTRDQSRLQLRYIHLRRLPKLLEQIDTLLSRMPQGKAQIQEQKKQQDDIVKFCDEALATSIKMESVATAERINNIEASLKSWKDFLNRVQDLHKNYESELEKVEKVCEEITNELSAPAPVSFSAIQSRLDLCRDLKRRISELSKNIEEANVTYDQLKECLSPYDMKMLSQRLWLIGQRQGDLEHHLLLQILWLEDRLETQQAFNRRHGRFVNWAEDLIKRFDKNSSADPTNKFLDLETRAKRLETEVEIELNLKNREYNALHAMANNIIDLSKEDAAQEKGKIMPKGQNRIDYEIMKSDVEKKIKEVDELWDQLKNLKCARLERKSKLTTTMNDLWKRMEDIKLWLASIEKKLEAPNVIEKSSKKCIDKLLKDHEAIQENIEKQSGNVGEVLNLCELFLGDPAVDVSGIDTNEFESAQQALEKRWKAVCLSSTERKNRILGAWELLLELSKICKEQEKWINEREKALQSLSNQADKLKLSDIQKMLGLLDKEKQELESKNPALKILDASYSKLAQESRLPADNIKQLAGPAKAMMSKWHNLSDKWKNVWDKISRINKLRDDFIKSQNGCIVLLTNISARLMQAELIPNAKKRLKKVNELEMELERESGVLRKADEIGLELMRTCPEDQNVSATQKMVDEYQVMWKQLRDRFADVKNKSLENVESKEIQVSTLAFETDSEVQVDTLPHLDRLTSRDAYGFELDIALRECDQNLTGLEKILRASEEELGAHVPTHKTLAKIIATCTSSVELVQHLNKTLLEDCGMNDKDARTAQVKEISDRFQDLVVRAREREKQLREASERGRLTCPICSGRNWQQLENDLWRLEQWIQYAEAIQGNRPSIPEGLEALEDVIQAHRELLIDLDSHKSIIVSLNIVGDHLADHAEDDEKARSLRERLKGLNLRWDNVCTQAAQWQTRLQKALIENPEFHYTIDDLFKFIDQIETVIRNSEPVDLAQDRVMIETYYKKFKLLSRDLEKFEPRVQSLQEAAVQLLDKGGSSRERLNALRLRLLGIRRLIKVYFIRLGAVLGDDSVQALDQNVMSLSHEMLDGADTMSQVPSSSTARTDGDGDIDNSSLRRGFRFLGRVFRASLPIQALMLLVLGAATLVPDEYYSCAFSNNARFQSYYPNGPPPI